ncbi:MAG: peptidylprolyl isomerase [Phycisphaerae bacterium]|jgi:cyclophilin family peptidyl-prolyl cis-trans isomerase
MFRMTVLCMMVGTLSPVLPQGCPVITTPDDTKFVDRQSMTVDVSGQVTAEADDTVVLTAVATADVAGGAVTYSWLQIAGPGVSLTGADQATASFVAPSLPDDQSLRFVVTTTNERGDIGRADIEVLVTADPDYGAADDTTSDRAPIARAGLDQTIAEGARHTLDGSNSRGDDLTYEWSQVSGTTVELSNPETYKATFVAPTYEAHGENRLEFNLEVLDRRDRRDTDRVVITVRERTAADDTTLNPQVTIKTTMGDIVVELDREAAPITVQNFLEYVADDFYDGTIFHRVVPDFVIQGGGYDADLEHKDTNDPIENESDNGLSNVRGSIAMARTSDLNSATSQFYINLVDNTGVDGNPDLDDLQYAVFGEVVSGMDVVDAIAAVTTHTEAGFNDVPVEDVIITDIVFTAGTTPAAEQ